MRSPLWLGSLVLMFSSVAYSQEPSVVAGGRARLSDGAPGHIERHSGTVVRAGADTIVLRLDGTGQVVPYALARTSLLEVSQGTRGHVGTGLWMGALIGGGAGALLGGVMCSSQSACSGGSDGNYTPIVAVVAAGLGAAGGMLIGAVIGAAYRSDRWVEVPSSRWRVAAHVDPRHLGLTLSMSFE